VLQRHALQKFHGDERSPVLLSDVIDGADVGMIQCGSGLSFTLETGKCLRVSRNFIWQELEGDEAVQSYVFGFVDNGIPLRKVASDFARGVPDQA
jgi:hypothetical protein